MNPKSQPEPVTPKYPPYIMRQLRESLDLEPEDTSKDHTINNMSPKTVFRKWLDYEGIIGYSNRIISLVEDIFGVSLEE